MLDTAILGLMPSGLSWSGAFQNDIVQMVLNAGPMVKFVLLVLFLFSLISWAIIFVKFLVIRRARIDTEDFLELFWETRDLRQIYEASEELTYSPVARLFRAGYGEFIRLRRIQSSPEKKGAGQSSAEAETTFSQRSVMDNLDRSLKRATIDQINRLERAVSFLATTGNTTPFIGLFGTVWGIMESFRGIGLKGSANLAVVAPGISEALIATAAGLAAAIPAVVAFNYFSHKISELRAEMDIFTSDFLSTVERQFVKIQRGGTAAGGL